jgi:hypothetical protein
MSGVEVDSMRKLVFAAALLGLLAGIACKKESQKVTSEMETAQKIAKLEQQVNAKQDEMNQLLQKYVHEGGSDVGAVMGQSLTPDQKALLEQKLKNEEGIGYRDLISDILKKQKDVEDLKVQVQELEKKLPSAVVVKRGDRHADIAMNFLTKDKGLDPQTAKKLVGQVNLMDELVPGFKVWNFYDNGVYGTFVTQGDASVSPYRVIQKAKQELVNARDTAVSQRDSLAKEKATLLEQVSDLERRRDQLNQEVAMLQSEREELLKKMQEMQNISDELKSKLNSVFYVVGWRQNMVKQGLVEDPWYAAPRLKKFDEASFPLRLDLRDGDTIVFTAKDAGVAKIEKIKIAPGSTFKVNADYAFTIAGDGQQCSVRMLSKDKFRAERIAILVN